MQDKQRTLLSRLKSLLCQKLEYTGLTNYEKQEYHRLINLADCVLLGKTDSDMCSFKYFEALTITSKCILKDVEITTIIENIIESEEL